jgi:arylsulfatase A-like enzyme
MRIERARPHSFQRPAGLLVALGFATLVAACDRAPAALPNAARPSSHHHDAAADTPNLILIVLDTARGDRMSHNGYVRMTTPHVDAVARNGVTYRQAHSVAPWTLPSHMSIFTGLLPGQHGATWAAMNDAVSAPRGQDSRPGYRFVDADRLLPVRLRGAGYSTVGFSDNAWVSRGTGFQRGFEHFYEMWTKRDGLTNGYAWLPPDIRTSPDIDHGDAGRELMQFKRHLLQTGPLREPFFLFFNFIDAHYPYSPPPPFRYAFSGDRTLGERIARFRYSEIGLQAGARPVDVRTFSPFYDAELAYVDFVVGMLVSWLREAGYYDESLIVITSDHGEHLGEHDLFSHQYSMAEELLHVPLIVKYPGNAGAGTVNDNPLVSTLDVYETLLHAAGVSERAPIARTGGAAPPPGSFSLDLAANPLDRRALIAEYDYSLGYLRESQRQYPKFSIEDHQVVRRVVYTQEGRYEFVERDGKTAPVPAGSSSNDSGREQAARALEAYLATLRGHSFEKNGPALDAETLERLRSLGYVR